ncbi:MAG: NYN domain-containing protein [Bacteroidales bacterium]|nr:NYN domain-containing protein [Bacteroidales bacterium]
MKPHSHADGLSHFLVACFFIYMTVNFYIDGYNFYYGLRAAKNSDAKWCSAYWIDFVELCRKFLGLEQELGKVVYFTATPFHRDKAARQRALLKVNKALHPTEFEVVMGRYLSKKIKCPNCNGWFPRPEEKKTDVNISVRLLGDCMFNATDRVVLVSADSDLVPPLNFIIQNFPDKKIRVMFPITLNCKETISLLHKNSLKVVFLEKNFARFKQSVLPDNVVVDGVAYSIPQKWKERL